MKEWQGRCKQPDQDVENVDLQREIDEDADADQMTMQEHNQ